MDISHSAQEIIRKYEMLHIFVFATCNIIECEDSLLDSVFCLKAVSFSIHYRTFVVVVKHLGWCLTIQP